MKIMFLVYSLSGGGAERMVARLANEFVNTGNQVSIAVFSADNIVYDIDERISIVDLSTDPMNKIKKLKTRINLLKLGIEKHKPDVLFAFTISMVPFAIKAVKGTGCKVIGAERANPKALDSKYQAVIKLISPKCDGYVFQTNGAKNYYPVKTQKKSCVIGNIAPFVGEYEKNKVMKNHICTAARLHTDKDYETLIRAMKRVVDNTDDAVLHIYGDGPLKESLEKLSNELNIADNIVFEGFSKNMIEEYKKYEMFVFSSKFEGMPNALIEAMSCGLAVVSSDCEYGPSDIIDDGVNGFLVPVGDETAMANRITELINDDKLRSSFEKEAKRVQEKYSKEHIVNQYYEYAQKVIQN